MKNNILILALLLAALPLFSQKRYFTKSGRITFAAGTAMEDIDGINNTVASVFDAGTGQIEYGVLVKGFEFKRALMQEHFNENYMESDKYPKALFKGKITNTGQVDFAKDGAYPVTVSGVLDMHGVKKAIETRGTLKVTGENVRANAEFIVALADFDIAIPGLVKDKISKTVSIRVDCLYNLLK